MDCLAGIPNTHIPLVSNSVTCFPARQYLGQLWPLGSMVYSSQEVYSAAIEHSSVQNFHLPFWVGWVLHFTLNCDSKILKHMLCHYLDFFPPSFWSCSYTIESDSWWDGKGLRPPTLMTTHLDSQKYTKVSIEMCFSSK